MTPLAELVNAVLDALKNCHDANACPVPEASALGSVGS
jgi:hypothetical protein